MDDGFNEQSRGDELPTQEIFPRYLSDFKAPLLSAEDEISLAEQSREGCQQSRQSMVLSNLPLVVNRVNRFKSRITAAKGFDIMDAVMEGNIGLIKAVERFLPEKGWRFSTYATHWIDQEIDRALKNQQETIRLPVHVHRDLAILYRVGKPFEQDLSHLSNEDVASLMNQEVAGLKGKTYDAPFVAKLKRIKEQVQQLISLDLPLSKRDDARSLVDSLYSTADISTPENKEAYLSAQQLIAKVLRYATPDEQQVLILHFGLFGVMPLTHDEVAEVTGYSRSRVGQLNKSGRETLKQALEREGLALDDLLPNEGFIV